MEEQASWKSHSFTLLVFTGIVVLASIFFILGMLVGRAQAQKPAPASASAASRLDAKTAPKEEKPELTFYESVKKEDAPALRPIAPRPDPPVPEKEKARTIEPEAAPPPPAHALNYQIGAFPKSPSAEKLLDAVKKKGFRAFILAPAADDSKPLFRVQVGPFTDTLDAEAAKKKLEAAGYQPILKK